MSVNSVRILGISIATIVLLAFSAPTVAQADSITCGPSGFTCAGGGYSAANSNTWAEKYFGWGAATTLGWVGLDGHNCTRYPAYRLAKNGLADPGFSFGMAHEWNNKVDPTKVNKTASVGSIAQWEGASWNGYAGHVAYVEAVTSTSITVTEDSWGGLTQKRVINVGSSSWPNAFIHLKDVTTTTTAALQPITGDWNGDGNTDIGLRRISTGMFYLKTGPTWSQTSVSWSSGAG